MKPSWRKYAYPVNVSRIASDVAARGIDIAPTRIRWELLARCLAGYAGEQGRDAFHQMAAVWPDYSRHDSEMCYNRALRQTGKHISIGYLKGVLKRHGIDIDHPRYRGSGPLQLVKPNPTKTTTKTMKKINFNSLLRSLLGDRSAIGLNPLIDLLLRLYPQQAVLMACQRYLIGFNSFKTGKMGDALIFWQVDDKRHIVNAKKIYYRFDGHRDKNLPPMVLYADNPQCLFYNISKIEKILGQSLDDNMLRMRLLFGFYVIEYTEDILRHRREREVGTHHVDRHARVPVDGVWQPQQLQREIPQAPAPPQDCRLSRPRLQARQQIVLLGLDRCLA